MFAPKNVITYHFQPAAGFTAEHLEQALAEYPFTPCGSQELSRTGWAAPASCVEGMVLDSHGILLIALKQEERILPAQSVREKLDEKVALIEAEQSRKVYRKEKLQLKDEVIMDMLPRSFTRSRITHALICPEQCLIHVDASSHTRAEELLNHLRQALGSLVVKLPQTQLSADKVLTGWLQGDPIQQGFALEDECELRDPMTEGGKITAKGQDLLSDEITAHIAGGYMVKRLALEWVQQYRFVLHEDLSIHRLRMVDEYRDQLDAETPEDVQAALEASVWRYGVQLSQLHNEIIQAMGGHADPAAFALEQEEDGPTATAPAPAPRRRSTQNTEQAVQISSKLYEARKQQIWLGGEDKFRSLVQQYRPQFETVMADRGSNNPIAAVTVLLENAKGHKDEGMLMHILLAVACELAEPSLGDAA